MPQDAMYSAIGHRAATGALWQSVNLATIEDLDGLEFQSQSAC
jgi:hypothetical protein